MRCGRPVARMEGEEMDAMHEEILTVPEAADYLRVNPASVYRMIQHGTLRPLRVGRVIRLTKTEIERWVEDQLTGVTTAS